VAVVADKTTVLLIDADRAYRDYYAQRLYASTIKYDVFQAATGRTGLDIIARLPIDCVVLEIDLPDMSGVEVMANLIPCPYRPERAIIVLTRFYNQFLANLAMKNGAQGALPKTAESGELLEASIVKAISKVKTLNRLVT
jgi:DNA-binding NarL/FixJ family response regulator